jgi:bla regulator protein blaR1
MTCRAHRLSFAGNLIVLSVAIGILHAQAPPPEPKYTYEVVSVRPSKPGEQGSRIMPGPQGGMRTQNTLLTQLISFAFKLGEYQLSGVPDWVQSQHFDVEFTPDKAEVMPGPGASQEQMEGFIGRNQQRMQAVLRDRFGLVLRAETKPQQMYALTIAKGGHKLVPADEQAGPRMRFGRGELTAEGAFINMLTFRLGEVLGRYVADETGLEGKFNMNMRWAQDDKGDEGPSLFTALTEQLGLKLESKKGPVPVFIIEKIEKPVAN